MRIQNNIAAVNTNRQLGVCTAGLAKSAEKISTGYRVNRAADDAAGLAISEKMRTQIRGLGQASRNIQDGISLLQLGDGALQSVHEVIHRMRELAVQAANDTNVDIDRAAIQKEISSLTSEINSIADSVAFNARKLFDGSVAGSYGWFYGLREDPMVTPMDPARITASSPFEEVRVPLGSQAAQATSATSGALPNTTIGSSHLLLLDGPPPTFPLEGEFIIRITDPVSAPSGMNFILDFSAQNSDGSFTSADFQAYFQNAFDAAFGPPGVPPTQGATITVAANGAISVQTHGLGGSGSRVLIGATNSNTGADNPGRPAGTIFANSAIFGASSSGSPSYDYHLAVGTRTITPAELTAMRANPSASALLWDLVPSTTVFTWQVQERQYNPAWGPPTSSGSYGAAVTIYTVSMTKAQIVANSGATTFAQANAWLSTQNDGTYFSGLSLGVPSVYASRDGTAYIDWNANASRIINDPALPYRYQTAVPYSTYLTNNNSSTASASVTSTYAVRIPEESGFLTITIGNVPTSATTTTNRSITIDFSEPRWNSATPQDLVNYINSEINSAAFRPVPAPTHTNSAYNSARPVATASLDTNGRLVITAAERSFTVTVEERVSDKPMFLATRSATAGANWTPTISIRDDYGLTLANVPIVAKDYNNIGEFVATNQNEFRIRGFSLSDEGGFLVVTSTAAGGHVTVGSISISGNAGHDWNRVFDSFGLLGLPPGNLVNGVTHPPEPAPDNSMWIQSGANAGQGAQIGVPRLNAQDLGLMLTAQDMANPGTYVGISTVFGTSQYADMPSVDIPGTAAKGFSLDVMTHEKAAAALGIFDNAINIISVERAQFGASTNRLEFSKANVDNAHENTTASESRIRDADLAKEQTKFVKDQIITQAATVMLAQANALPQGVLQLLGS